MLLFYPMTGSEDIHNYILSDGAEMEGAGKGKGRRPRAAVPRAREDGLPTTATRGYSMMNGTEGAASRDRRQSNGGRLKPSGSR